MCCTTISRGRNVWRKVAAIAWTCHSRKIDDDRGRSARKGNRMDRRAIRLRRFRRRLDLHLLKTTKDAGLARLQDMQNGLIFADIVAAMQNPGEAREAHVPANALQVVHQHTPISHLQGYLLAVVGRPGVASNATEARQSPLNKCFIWTSVPTLTDNKTCFGAEWKDPGELGLVRVA